MMTKRFGDTTQRVLVIASCVMMLSVLVLPQIAEARRGGVRHGGYHGGGRHHHHHHHHHYHPHPHPHPHFHVHFWHPHLWHPIGFFLTALTVTAIVVSVNNQDYHYDNGVYYQETTNDSGEKGYVAVTAPIGAKVPSLPDGNEKTTVSGKDYWYYGGVFYVKDSDGKYVVVQGPVGAVVQNLPDGAKEEYHSDVLYYAYGGIYFQPKSVNGQTQYEVVAHP